MVVGRTAGVDDYGWGDEGVRAFIWACGRAVLSVRVRGCATGVKMRLLSDAERSMAANRVVGPNRVAWF
jgi:hypothetical protein